jgi:LAO/AO transport system kinase
VGQSETAVAGMTDMYCLLQLPNAGDDLQAIKKGVMELADLVVINKADIDAAAATRAQAQITSSLRLLGYSGHSHAAHDEAVWHPQVMQLSALKVLGLDQFWAAVETFRRLQTANGRFTKRRQDQARDWMWERIHAGLRQQCAEAPAVRAALAERTRQVLNGELAASTAARELLQLFSAV